MNAPSSGLLAALRFGDSAFPSGGFAFSQGIEGLAPLLHRKPRGNEIAGFVREQIACRWAPADRVALALAFRSGSDLDRIAAIDREFDRSTFCESLRSGARRNGAALLSAFDRIGGDGASAYRHRVAAGSAPGSLPAVQALVWREAGLDEAVALALSGWSLVSSMLSAATRLALVGALQAQTLMGPLLSEVGRHVEEPVPDDAVIAGFSPFGELAAMRQANMATKLFSN